MYTTRQILGTTLGLTVSGVKHDAKGPAVAPAETPEVTSAKQALKNLNDYKAHSSDSIRLTALLDNVHSAIDTLAKDNQVQSVQIETELNQAIASESNIETKEILEDLQKARTEKLQKSAAEKAAAEQVVRDSTRIAREVVIPAWAPATTINGAINPASRASLSQTVSSQKDIAIWDINFNSPLNDADPVKKLDNRLKVLSDFDGASGVEKKNKMWGTGTQKYIVGEMQVYNILKDTLKTPADLTALMSRFGIVENWNGMNGNNMRDAFRDKVIKKADDVASISRVVMGDRGAWAGIVSVLAGTEKEYLQNLVSNALAQKQIETVIQKDSVLGMKIVSTLLSIGVGIASMGRAHVSFETRDLDKGHPLSIILGNSVNLTAKLRMFEAALQLNVNDRETKYIKDTLKFSESLSTAIKPGTVVDMSKLAGLTDQDKKIVEFYNTNVSSLPVGSDKALIDELSRNHLIALAKAGDGVWFKGIEAGYNLISKTAYVGIVGQYIGSRIEVPRANGSVLSDLAVNRKTVSLSDLGIKEEKMSDGKYTYTLPVGYKDTTGDIAKMWFALKDGVYSWVTLAPLGFSQDRIYHVNGDIETVLTVDTNGNRKVTQPAKINNTLVTPEVRESVSLKNQTSETISKLNEENSFKEFVSQVLFFSRQWKGTAFDKMLIAAGDNDMKTALVQLNIFAKENPKFGNQIKAYLKDNFDNIKHLSQLTYLSKGIQNNKEVSQKDYLAARKAVIAAEDRLAPESKNTRTEAIFARSSKHTPTHITDIGEYAGQALSVSVYATPANATHRIDKYTGSIPVSGDIVPLDKNTESRQIARIIGDHTVKIEQQRTKLNKELFDGKDTVTQVEYMDMLKTGTIPTSLATLGLSFVAGKWPKFFEARAMIHGSICANKTEWIGYPQFTRMTKLEGKPAVYNTETTPAVEQIQPPTLGVWGLVGEKIASVTEVGISLTVPKRVDTPSNGEPDKPVDGTRPATPGQTAPAPAPAPAPVLVDWAPVF